MDRYASVNIFLTTITLVMGIIEDNFILVSKKGEIFNGISLVNFTAVTLMQCCIKCSTNPECVAMNYLRLLKKGDGSCELLSVLNPSAKSTSTTHRTYVGVEKLKKEPWRFSYCADAPQGTGLSQLNIAGKDINFSCASYWLVIQRRLDGSVNFERTWADFKKGFGTLEKEHWLGNDNINQLTSLYKCILEVVVEDDNKRIYQARYSGFSVGDETQGYKLSVSKYEGGTTGDFFLNKATFGYANGKPFATKDRDTTDNCVKRYRGAWWQNSCYQANLNGVYGVACTTATPWCIKIVPLQRYGLNLVRVVMKITPSLF